MEKYTGAGALPIRVFRLREKGSSICSKRRKMRKIECQKNTHGGKHIKKR